MKIINDMTATIQSMIATIASDASDNELLMEVSDVLNQRLVDCASLEGGEFIPHPKGSEYIENLIIRLRDADEHHSLVMDCARLVRICYGEVKHANRATALKALTDGLKPGQSNIPVSTICAALSTEKTRELKTPLPSLINWIANEDMRGSGASFELLDIFLGAYKLDLGQCSEISMADLKWWPKGASDVDSQISSKVTVGKNVGVAVLIVLCCVLKEHEERFGDIEGYDEEALGAVLNAMEQGKTVQPHEIIRVLSNGRHVDLMPDSLAKLAVDGYISNDINKAMKFAQQVAPNHLQDVSLVNSEINFINVAVKNGAGDFSIPLSEADPTESIAKAIVIGSFKAMVNDLDQAAPAPLKASA